MVRDVPLCKKYFQQTAPKKWHQIKSAKIIIVFLIKIMLINSLL